MFSAAAHLGVKKDEDRSGHFAEEGRFKLILCDGIGSLTGSGEVAGLVVDEFLRLELMPASRFVSHIVHSAHAFDSPKGGTTLLIAHGAGESRLTIEHLGNGGAIHLHGDFADMAVSGEPYMYAHLLLPHIASDDSLTRHLSHEGIVMNVGYPR